MNATWGRRACALLCGAVLAGGMALATPLRGGADGVTGTAAATVTLTSSQDPSGYGEPLVLTATVIPESGGAVPDGTVTFSDAGTALGTVSLDGSGQAALPDSTLSAGGHSIVAAYSGSPTYAPAASTPLAQTVTAQGTSTALLSALNPAIYGQSVVVVASVLPAAGSGVPGGTVRLLDSGVAIASAPLVDGTAAFAPATLDAGIHELAAAYAGDGNFSGSTSPAIEQEVDTAGTTTTLTATPAPATAGLTVLLTATVSADWATPSGEVSFAAGDATLGTASLNGGVATLSVTFDHPGHQELRATYSGDQDFAASQSEPVSLTVLPGRTCTGDGDGDGDDPPSCCVNDDVDCSAASSESSVQVDDFVTDDSGEPGPVPPQAVTVGVFPASVNQGQSVTLTSVVLGGGALSPSGTVTWVADGSVLGSASTLPIGSSGDAVASLRSVLAPGRHAITARYQPDAAAQDTYAQAGSAAPAVLRVSPVAAATTLTVASSQNPLPSGSSAIFTATVNHPASTLTATGPVTFSVDGSAVGSAGLDGLGQAALPLSGLDTGTHTVTASYAGDSAFAPSTGTVVETVVVRPPPLPQSPTPSPAPGSPPASAPATTPLSATATPAPVPARSVTTPGPTSPTHPAGRSGGGGSPSGSGTGAGPRSSPASAASPPNLGVPPIGVIGLVEGIQLGSTPQIVAFLLAADGLVALAILLASRRGRRMTRRSVDWEEEPAGGDELD
jgi:hypothetical protein